MMQMLTVVWVFGSPIRYVDERGMYQLITTKKRGWATVAVVDSYSYVLNFCYYAAVFRRVATFASRSLATARAAHSVRPMLGISLLTTYLSIRSW
jgi:hypothetical protein